MRLKIKKNGIIKKVPIWSDFSNFPKSCLLLLMIICPLTSMINMPSPRVKKKMRFGHVFLRKPMRNFMEDMRISLKDNAIEYLPN